MEDQIAISRIKQGDPGGLEALVGVYQVRAVYTAYMIVFDRSLAEEIAQTAFVRIVEKIQQFDEKRPFAPWFFRIVVNEALRVARYQRQTISLDDDPDEDVSAVARWLSDPQPQPEKLVEAKETQQVLLAALKRLKPEQRAVVVMHYYFEMSEADMSARLDRPVSTIKWWLRAARERLQSLLRSSRMFEDRD
ncbi:MAG: RNA polymerase subunit sigma-24 [Chloroflexi bacterium HGW-Chloroflexi-6]|nr:MAG: RNA polymerase subunit sigma-24 [Chloroflexi bacterium HGW-Chloroflexi-6]